MEVIKVFNLITGEEKEVEIFECFKQYVTNEKKSLEKTVQDYPDIETVKDGFKPKSVEVFAKILDELQDKEDWLTDYESKFNFETDRINDVIAQTDDAAQKCVLYGERYAYLYCRELIKRIRKSMQVKL